MYSTYVELGIFQWGWSWGVMAIFFLLFRLNFIIFCVLGGVGNPPPPNSMYEYVSISAMVYVMLEAFFLNP